MSKPIYVLNGPNLNLLGTRQPEIYGHETLNDVEALCHEAAAGLNMSVAFFQSNAEHELIGWIQEARAKACGIAINAAALTHTSLAVLDALNMFDGPVIEVHISNVHKREHFRHFSYVSQRADGVIAGCGTQGYVFAIERIAKLARG